MKDKIKMFEVKQSNKQNQKNRKKKLVSSISALKEILNSKKKKSQYRNMVIQVEMKSDGKGQKTCLKKNG